MFGEHLPSERESGNLELAEPDSGAFCVNQQQIDKAHHCEMNQKHQMREDKSAFDQNH
jgi:hypothetical protein